MSSELKLVLSYADKTRRGTRLIPVDDSCSSLSVDSIGSYYAPKQYRLLNQTLDFVHNIVSNKNGENSEKSVEHSSVTLSPVQRRKLLLTNNCYDRSSNESDLLLYSRAINSIDDTLLPKYDTKLRDKTNLSKFIRNSLLDSDNSQDIIEKVLIDAETWYKQSVKESIIDYILLNEEISKRYGFSDQNRKQSTNFLFISPWNESYKNAKQFNEKYNNVCHETIIEITNIWNKQFACIDIFDFKLSDMIKTEEYKSTVIANCRKLNTVLRYEWMSRCSEVVLNKCSSLITLDSVKDEHLFNAIATLMSRLMRQLIINNIEKWTNILTVRSNKSLPIFDISIECSSLDVPGFVPPINTWKQLLTFPIYEIIKANTDVPRIESQLILMKPNNYRTKHIMSVDISDHRVSDCFKQIVDITVTQISHQSIIDYYQREYILTIFEPKTEAKNKFYDTEELRKLREKRDTLLVKLSQESNHVKCGIFMINCKKLNAYMYNKIKTGVNQLIESRVNDILSLAQNICDSCLAMEHNISKTWHSTSAMVDHIRQFEEYRSNINLMLYDIEYIENHWSFLVEDGAIFLNDTHFELMHKLYNWPQRIKVCSEQNERRFNASKTEANNQLKIKITAFESKLKNLESDINSVKKKRLSSPIECISDNISLLKEIDSELNNASKELQDINTEEKLLGWASVTKFKLLEELVTRKQPLDNIWQMANLFENYETEWMSKSIKFINIKQVKETVEQLLTKTNDMTESFQSQSNNDLLLNANTLQTRIASFKHKYIPLLQVLSNPVLKDRHWRKISAILGQDITSETCRTLSDMVSITNATQHINEIECLGSIAVKEHALEMFLEKMKNEWIEEWPKDALDIAANKFLEGENLELDLKENCAKAFKYIHEDARQFLSQYVNKSSPIKVFVTPPLFIELILTFKDLLKKKQIEMCSQRDRYLGGVDKLESAAFHVEIMKNKLVNEYKPQLVIASEHTETLMIAIEKETLEIEIKKEIIATDEAMSNKSASLAQQIKDECTKELAHAIPAIKCAINALNTLKSDDITFLRTMKKPPNGVRMVLEAVCIIKGIQPERRLDPTATTKLVNDYWSAALKMLSSDIKFLDSLISFDRDNISRDAIAIVRNKYLSNPEFDPSLLCKVSIACEGLAKWVKAIDIYDRVINVVKPKQEKLAKASVELSNVMEKLRVKKTELQQTSDKLQQLNDEFSAMSKKKKELEENIEFCSIKLDRAEQLIRGLEGEKIRWKEAAIILSLNDENIVGDILLAAATIVYTSALNSQNRNLCILKWQKYLHTECDLNLTANQKFNIIKILAKPSEMVKITHCGISGDQFSTENAIIAQNTMKYPFIIDPQKVANKWIQALYPKLVIIQYQSLNEECVQESLYNAVKCGNTVLIEINDLNNQELSNILTPILKKEIIVIDEKQFIKCGNNAIEYSKEFNLYMCSKKLVNLSPITSSRVTLINWCLTKETECYAANKNSELALLLQARAEQERQLVELEDQILNVLTTSKINVLEDENAIQLLVTYKNLAEQITKVDI